MKRSVFAACFIVTALFSQLLFGQEPQKESESYVFTPIKELKVTPVKNQNRSSTCWSFSGVAFLESELLRMGKPEVNLSPMFVVRNAYVEKADRFVRFNGTNNFGPGGSFFDVVEMVKKYGIVPMEV
ncbi:MAG: aminopeptidase, partial [Bacteroidales bacterium]|nr:aminopeptidase [Bacteroidales bacterium]